MASAMQSQMTSQQCIRSTPVPFRSSARVAPPRQRVVVAKAAQEPAQFVKGAVATFAAAAIALTPFSAGATEGGIMPSRNRDEDNAARAFLDSQEKKGPAVQSRSTDPNSGKLSPSAGEPLETPRAQEGSKKGPNTKNTVAEQVESFKQQKTKGPGAGGKAEAKLDPGAVISEANKRSPKPAAFVPGGSSLQVNVASTDVFGRGEVGTQRDQIENQQQKLKEGAANPAQAASNAATKFGARGREGVVQPDRRP